MRLHIVPAITLCIALWLTGLTAASAQDSPPPTPLTLEDCLALAQQQQIDVLTGQQTLRSAQARAMQAKSAYYPQVTIGYTPVTAHGSSGGANGRSNTGANLTVTQNFYDGGLREAQVGASKAGVTQNTAALARTRQTVTFIVTRAYFDALRARHLAEVADARVTYLEGQRELIKTRIAVGDAAQADELPILAQLANARVDQLSAKNAIRTSLIQLQNAIGLNPQSTFAIVDITLPVDQEIRPMESYQEEALALRPDITQTQAAVQGAQSSVKSAKIAMSPRLVSSGQYEANNDGATSSNWSISAGIAYDLFDGKRNRAAYDEAQASLTASQQRSAQLVKDITADVQEAYLNLTNAHERMAATEIGRQAAQQNFEAQEARYKEGLAIPLDLLNAQVDMATAQSNAVQARYDYYVALAQLDYAIGKQGGSNGK